MSDHPKQIFTLRHEHGEELELYAHPRGGRYELLLSHYDEDLSCIYLTDKQMYGLFEAWCTHREAQS